MSARVQYYSSTVAYAKEAVSSQGLSVHPPGCGDWRSMKRASSKEQVCAKGMCCVQSEDACCKVQGQVRA